MLLRILLGRSNHVAHIGKLRNAYKTVVGKVKGERQLGRHRHGWEDNIKCNLYKIEYKVVDWSHLTQDRDQWQVDVRTVMNLQVP
jgi:hypothetical protein